MVGFSANALQTIIVETTDLKDKQAAQVSRALILADKGSHLNRLNRTQEALSLVDEAIHTIDPNDISTLDRLLRLKASCFMV